MLTKLKNGQWAKGSLAYGIEIHSEGNGRSYWSLVQLGIVKKKEIKIIKQQFFYEVFDVKRLSELKCNRKIPVLLCLTGAGILTEKLRLDEEVGQQLFPGADMSEIYYKLYNTTQEQWCSFVHKAKVNEYLESFSKAGFFIWDIEVSPLVTYSILPLLAQQTPQLHYDEFVLRPATNSVDVQAPLQEHNWQECNIGNEATNTSMLPALASAISFYTNVEATDYLPLEELKKEYLAYKKGLLAGYSFLGILLIVLLVNILFFNKYNAELQVSQNDLITERYQKTQIDSLRKDVGKKQQVLKQMGIQRQIPASYLSDRFAACIPTGVQLNRLTINPPIAKLKENKPFQCKEGIIEVEGFCDEPKDFTKLMDALILQNWVIKINRKEYRSNQVNGYFVLEFTYEQQ